MDYLALFRMPTPMKITGGSYRLISTIGQPDAVASAGTGFTFRGGFLPGTFQPWQRFLPLIKK